MTVGKSYEQMRAEARRRRQDRDHERKVQKRPDLQLMRESGDIVIPASAREVDFRGVPWKKGKRSGIGRDTYVDTRPRDSKGRVLTEKQIRARIRRRMKKASPELLTEEEFKALYKPVEEWDLEELANGRPRSRSGTFRGPAPAWVDRRVFEQAQERFKAVVRTQMNGMAVTALDVVAMVMSDEELDARGKPMVPASVKLQAAQFLMEHVVGKPKQHVQTDISVKLQGLLAAVVANPNQALAAGAQGGQSPHPMLPAYEVAHLPGHTIPMGELPAKAEEEPVDAEWSE